MKVYVLLSDADYEGATFWGVYSTDKLAKEAGDSLDFKQLLSDIVRIEECELDNSPRAYFS